MTPAIMRKKCATEEETRQFGTALSERLGPGDVIGLNGPLGAGKSVLARSIIRAYMKDPDLLVPSPSFTLIQIYEPPNQAPVWHVDLYRLEQPDDLWELGLDDAFGDSVMLVEWPDRAESFLPENSLMLTIDIEPDGCRLISMKDNARWHDRLSDLFAPKEDKTA